MGYFNSFRWKGFCGESGGSRFLGRRFCSKDPALAHLVAVGYGRSSRDRKVSLGRLSCIPGCFFGGR